MRETKQSKFGTAGFTMIELLIAMVVSGVVAAAAYSVYVAQQSHYTAQIQVTDMQQNLRAVMDLMTSDIRMAGFDGGSSDAGKITTGNATQFSFTVDLDESGAIDQQGEHIGYDLYGLTGGTYTLGRSLDNDDNIDFNEHQPVSDNISNLEFNYLDEDNNPTTVLDEIRRVEISLLVRADQEDRRFTNTTTYTTAAGVDWGPAGDHYRRRFQIMPVECRNASL